MRTLLLLLLVAGCQHPDQTDSDGGGGTGSAAACDDPATCNYDAKCPPFVDPAALPACAADAHCVPSTLVTDAAERAQLATCSDGSSLCVPDAFIRTGGKFTPPTCTSAAGAEGRCLSRALPAVTAQEALLPQDTCTTNERCVPCFDPITGAATGACSLSCDTGPTQPAVKLATCCDSKSHCVPTSSIPAADREYLSGDSCTTGNLCVPDQVLLAQPIPACSANSFILGNYTGVCLSDCFDLGALALALDQGNCAGGTTCTPCMVDGQATGAPGC